VVVHLVVQGLWVTMFNPTVAGVGTHTITYTYTDANGCTNTTTQNILVNPTTIANITSSNSQQCV
jgi:hypothetical protein